MKRKTTRHAVYNINYHFVWIPKYRKSVLTGEIAKDLNTMLESYAERNEIEILSLSIQPDHVHLFVSCPPRYSPAKVINLFKGASARELLKKYPHLYQHGHLWTRSYYIGTAGTVSDKTIQHYIEECQSE